MNDKLTSSFAKAFDRMVAKKRLEHEAFRWINSDLCPACRSCTHACFKRSQQAPCQITKCNI